MSTSPPKTQVGKLTKSEGGLKLRKRNLLDFGGQNPKLSHQLEFGAKSIEKKFNLKTYVVKSTKQEQGGYV